LQAHALEVVESLERQKSGIELLNVVALPDRIRATVRVPSKKRRIIEAVLERYKTKLDSRSGRPQHQDLVENIDAIRLATEHDLWTDSVPFPGLNDAIWWEVWLYHSGGD